MLAFLDAFAFDSLEAGWASGVDASVELFGVLLVLSALEFLAGLVGSVESPSLWAGNSLALVTDLVVELRAVNLVAESVFNLEGESFVAGSTLAGTVLESVVLRALEALSVDEVETGRASVSDADTVGEGEVLLASSKLALLLLIAVLQISWALNLDTEVGLGIDSVSSLADNLLASGGSQGRSGCAFSLDAGLAIGGWNARLVASLDAGVESIELDHVESGWASGSDAFASGEGVEFVADNLLADSVLGQSRSGFAGLLDAGGTD